MLTYDNGVFFINGQKTFLMGGELHYFRLPKAEWEDRLLKMKACGLNLVSTYVPWIWHEKTEGSIDLTGYSSPERDLMGFIRLVHKHGLYLCLRPGPYVMSELLHAGLPEWLLSNYPEIRAMKDAITYHPVYELVSYLHPKYLEKVRHWHEAVFSLTAPLQIQYGGPIIMLQLDNEAGMFHWVTKTPDLSPNTLTHFYNYLELNRSTGAGIAGDSTDTPFDSTDQLAAELGNNPALLNQYRKFERHYICRYITYLTEEARTLGMEVPVIINVHGFTQQDYAKRGNLYPIGLSQLMESFSIPGTLAAGDYYIGNVVYDNVGDLLLANVLTQAAQPEGQPLFSAEFQSGFQNAVPRLQPNTHDLNSRICIGQGMTAINYYMFAGGFNYESLGILSSNHDWQAPIGSRGDTRRSYVLLNRLKKACDALGDFLLSCGTHHDTLLALDMDMFLTDYRNDACKSQVETMTQERDNGLYNGLGKFLAYENLHVKGCNLRNTVTLSPEKDPTMIVYTGAYMDGDIQEKLIAYAKEGGRLFLYPKIPLWDRSGAPCRILKDALGLAVDTGKNHDMMELCGVDGIGVYGGQIYPGLADECVTGKVSGIPGAGIVNLGKGKVGFIGAHVETGFDYVREGLTRMLELLEIGRAVRTDGMALTQWMPHRTLPEAGILFINQLDEYDKSIRITLQGEDSFEGHLITVRGREGLMLPLNLPLRQGLTLRYTTQEIEAIQTEETLCLITFRMKTPQLHLALDGDIQAGDIACISHDESVSASCPFIFDNGVISLSCHYELLTLRIAFRG